MTPFEIFVGLAGACGWAAIACRAPRGAMDELAWRARSERLTLGWGLFGVAVFMLLSATVASASLQWADGADKTQFLRALFVGNLISGFAIVLCLLGLLYFYAVPLVVVGGRRLKFHATLCEALLALATWLPLVFVVHAVARSVWPQEIGRENFIEQALVLPQPPDVRLLAALCAVVRAPVVEELAFRGFLLTALAAQFGVWPACVASAIAFAAVHSAWPDPIPLVVVGVMFGSAYARTGSLMAPIFAHALYNGTMTVLALMPKS